MQRILVDLPEQTIKDLEELAQERRVSRAEMIRVAATRFIESEKMTLSSTAQEKAFGLWKSNPMTDEELQSLRAEWGAS